MRRNRLKRIVLIAALLATGATTAALAWVSRHGEKRVCAVVPGKILRGAWQEPQTLRSLIKRHRIRTVVTLTAINEDDPKYVAQAPVLREAGVAWEIIPMRGSTATMEQLRAAADLAADPSRQPVFFHCVGGHHRSNLVHAAYLIRHEGWSAEEAWDELQRLPWMGQARARDEIDRRIIAAFAAREALRDDAKAIGSAP